MVLRTVCSPATTLRSAVCLQYAVMVNPRRDPPHKKRNAHIQAYARCMQARVWTPPLEHHLTHARQVQVLYEHLRDVKHSNKHRTTTQQPSESQHIANAVYDGPQKQAKTQRGLLAWLFCAQGWSISIIHCPTSHDTPG